MHRVEKGRYLLYIEPTLEQRSETPIDDDLVNFMELLLYHAYCGTANYSDSEGCKDFTYGECWRGHHINCDGEMSEIQDYLIADGRYITNSLATHYLRWYRSAIPQWMIEAIEDLLNEEE